MLDGSRSLAPNEVDFGYCPGGCGIITIPPGGVLEAMIDYDVFGDEAAIAEATERILSFSAQPFYCGAK
jgi:hypothetical protein